MRFCKEALASMERLFKELLQGSTLVYGHVQKAPTHTSCRICVMMHVQKALCDVYVLLHMCHDACPESSKRRICLAA
eukprot:350766-Chlamydomonas_euryale.AAC.4